MKNIQYKLLMTVMTFVIMMTSLAVSVLARGEEIKINYLYNLSNFTGSLPYDWVRVSVDQRTNEIYVVSGNEIRVFNENGMEIHRFGDDLDLGHVLDATADQEGNVLLLSYKGSKSSIVRCNYRGEPKQEIEIKGLPQEFSGFTPNSFIFRDGNLYLASLSGMKIVIADSSGNFVKGFDIISLFGMKEQERAETGISGFNLDRDGNMLFTIPVLFKAYILSPDGRLASFGLPGGAPGRFNVVAGIVSDSRGNYLVADILKSAIIVFDKDHNFLSEFNYRGEKPGNLIAPRDLAIDSRDRLYVTQSRKRGVSVYRVDYN